jgi:Na+-driven multidrug efflux pump
MGNALQISQRGILAFWAPLAATWLMMSVEGPFLAAIIARLAEPKFNLAAFGVAFAIALVVEAPIIAILSASTALVEGPRTLRMLRRFTFTLNGAITAAMVVVIVEPVYGWLARDLIGLPDEVARLTRISLVLLLPWPGAIGYRRFYQGLLIRGNRTRLVAYGTVIRLVTMATTALVLFLGLDLPGAWVGAAALSAGVGAEAVASRWMAIATVRRLATADRGDDTPLTYRSVWTFYYPLALTATIGLAIHPLVTFFIWGSRNALESQAVLPVINALSFIFRSAGLSFHEVAIALLARTERNLAPVRRFAAVLGALSSVGLAVVAWTPLAEVWFRGVSGLSPELTEFAIVPTRILTLLPALSVLLSLQRAILVHDRNTAPITWSTVVEVVGIAVVLALMIRWLDVVGATAAAIAYLAGRVAGVLVLVPPLARRSANEQVRIQ